MRTCTCVCISIYIYIYIYIHIYIYISTRGNLGGFSSESLMKSNSEALSEQNLSSVSKDPNPDGKSKKKLHFVDSHREIRGVLNPAPAYIYIYMYVYIYIYIYIV